MNTETLLSEIKLEFKDVTLGDGFTLLEEDFSDTSYLRKYPHQYPYDENDENYFSKMNVLNEIKNSDLILEEKKYLILAIEEEKRVKNQYTIWQEIPFSYLDKYAHGFYFIKPNVYIFYTASLIKNLILNKENFKGFAFDIWLSRLLMESPNNTFLIQFNAVQLKIIDVFLSSLLTDDYIIELVNIKNIKNALKIIQNH